jgi:hypothetical protein
MPDSEPDRENGLTLVLTARVPVSGVTRFQAYEDVVLPLLGEHGGTLQRRLRNADGTIEVHIVHFGSSEGLARFRNDPRRAAASPLLTASGAITELVEVQNVE